MTLADLDWFGIAIDEQKNASVRGESRIEAPASRTQIWIMPTNEELVVARQTKTLLEGPRT